VQVNYAKKVKDVLNFKIYIGILMHNFIEYHENVKQQIGLINKITFPKIET